jgi:N-acetylmuramoyl-L-alanine amidase
VRLIDTIIVHQSDTTDGTVEAIRRYHVEVKKWKDIGYHYVVYNDASVHKGRPNSEVGAHCEGNNATSIGICVIGKGAALPLGEGYMTKEKWAALLKLCYEVMQAYGVSYTRVFGHREMPSGKKQGKTCPGFSVATLRKLLAQGE